MRRLQSSAVLIIALLFVIPAYSCRNISPSDTKTDMQQTKNEEAARAPQAAAPGAYRNDEEASCSAFVQKFYDWDWNQFADKDLSPHSIEDVLQLRPSVLSPELASLIKKERDAVRATGKIGNLDFDPFLNSQDMSGKFMVTSVHVSNGLCRAIVKGSSEVRPELKKSESTWIFTNFHYSFYSEDGKNKRFPDDDLMHILNR
jgi:hypothetical protein